MIYHVIQAPSDLVPNPDEISIFLAGSIEMGKAKPWHDAVASQIARRTNQPIAFYNYNNVVLTAEQAGYPNHVSNDIDANIAKVTDQISSDISYRRQLESQGPKEDDLVSDEDSSDEVHPEDQETEYLD